MPRRRNPREPISSHEPTKNERVWLEAAPSDRPGMKAAWVVVDGKYEDGFEGPSWPAVRDNARRSASAYAKRLGQTQRPVWHKSHPVANPGRRSRSNPRTVDQELMLYVQKTPLGLAAERHHIDEALFETHADPARVSKVYREFVRRAAAHYNKHWDDSIDFDDNLIDYITQAYVNEYYDNWGPIETNPGKRHMACGDLSKKRCDQLNAVYESARDRGYSKKRAAQQARGVVRKQVAKDKRARKNTEENPNTKASERIILSNGDVMTLAEAIDQGRVELREGVSGKTGKASYTAWEAPDFKIGWGISKTLYESRKGLPISAARSRRHEEENPAGGGTVSERDVRELILWIDNSEPLYRQWQAIVKNLWKFKHKGTYDHDRAIDGFEHLANAAAKSYNREIERSKASGYGRFSVATRRAVAKAYADSFEDNDRDETSLDPKRSNPTTRRRNPEGAGTHARTRMLADRLASGG